jgi:hypothetical protein
LDEYIDKLVQVNPGTYSINDPLTGTAPAEPGHTVRLNASIYENDPGGPQVSTGRAFEFVGSGVYSLDLVDNTGDACDVTMRVVFRSMMAP